MNSIKPYIYGIFSGCLITFYYQTHYTNNANTSSSIKPWTPPVLLDKETKKRDLQFENLMEIIQAERMQTLRAACFRFKPLRYANKTTINLENFISKKYNISACNLRKCGSSAWLRAFFVMEDVYTVDDYLNNRIRGDNLMKLAKKTITLSSIANETTRKTLWKKSIKVITVRNPFSRLVSAYLGKMLPTGRGYLPYYVDVSNKINKEFRHLRHNVSKQKAADVDATFEDFVNYLVHGRFNKDPHWDSYYDFCKLCQTEYNYIIKFETLNNDMEYLKQKINISSYHTQAFFPESNFKTNWNLVEKTFKTIPKELGLKLYEKYRIDFEMFGYGKPDWFS